MGLPVFTCSSPSSFIISVPDATLLPRTFRPILFSNSSISSGGKPSGYTGKGLSNITPASSQCPVVVSFPADFSAAFPYAAVGSFTAGTPSISMIFPIPIFCMFGSESPPTALATLPSVLLPSSPYLAASGNSPTPTLSRTIRITF